MRGADSLSARFAAARTPALRSRGNTAATRENAIPAAIANPCRGRCSHCARRRVSEANRTAGPALRPEIVPGCSRRRGVREGHAPPLHGIRARPAKWDCRSRPGERRAGCPHPAGPRGGAGFRGWDKSRPTGKFCVPGKPGGHDVCPGLQGRGMPLPYMASGHDRPNGIAAAARANVGRDALIPPGPAAAQGSAGGINPALRENFVFQANRAATMFAPVCRGGACPSPTWHPGTTGQMGLPHPPGRT